MKKKLLTIFLITFSYILIGQHSDEFIRFAKQLTPVDTIFVGKKYKKEGQKETGSYYHYQHLDYIYQFSQGNWKYFYGENVVMWDDNYDDFGNLISWKVYHQDGYVLEEGETLSLDTSAKNLEEFLNIKHKYNQHLTAEKKYKYSKNLKKTYLFSEGKKLNNKKTGRWVKYNIDGTIKTEKIH